MPKKKVEEPGRYRVTNTGQTRGRGCAVVATSAGASLVLAAMKMRGLA